MMSRSPARRNFAALLILSLTSAPAADMTAGQIEAAFGAPVLVDENLWDDGADEVANRLAWPLESQTSNDSSFRKYPGPEERILGCRPYSMALHAEDGKPSSLSIIFANKGDSVTITDRATGGEIGRAKVKQIADYKRAIQSDRKTLTEMLTKLFGEPTADRFGQGRQTRESVKRWDWNGHAFLLAAPREEYVALRIMPVESADAGGKSRISDSQIRARVASRVERRPNGDVILKDMPMVNQGPKGYCVPATWERVMRYMGVPADMYALAMAGQSGAGGGTSLAAISAGARESIVRSGRKIDTAAVRIDPGGVAKFIDRGLPIMWAMFSTSQFNATATSRIPARAEMTDPAAWKKELERDRKAARKFHIDRSSGHVCMIIGYNKQTGEIAVSDSWGPQFAERWVTPEEATAVSQGVFTVINF